MTRPYHRGDTAQRVSGHMRAELARVDDPDVLAATIYTQTWKCPTSSITFVVLALDDQMAEEMGGIRLVNKGNDIMRWTLVKSYAHTERNRSAILAALCHEDPDETKLREEAFKARGTELSAGEATDAMTTAFELMRERRRW
jgi:hypothetical protein